MKPERELLRITSGRYRGRALSSPEGEGTRPLLTRLRKSLADILRPKIQGAKLLELFGGTGAISFELLSNGADEAHLVELDPKAAAIITANAKKLGAKATVATGDALKRIELLHRSDRTFDLVIVAPPYGKGLQKSAMDALAAFPILGPGGLAVVQREKQEPFWEPHGGFVLERTREYGRTVFDFYQYRGTCD